jgi:hypothetical protein
VRESATEPEDVGERPGSAADVWRTAWWGRRSGWHAVRPEHRGGGPGARSGWVVCRGPGPLTCFKWCCPRSRGSLSSAMIRQRWAARYARHGASERRRKPRPRQVGQRPRSSGWCSFSRARRAVTIFGNSTLASSTAVSVSASRLVRTSAPRWSCRDRSSCPNKELATTVTPPFPPAGLGTRPACGDRMSTGAAGGTLWLGPIRPVAVLLRRLGHLRWLTFGLLGRLFPADW